MLLACNFHALHWFFYHQHYPHESCLGSFLKDLRVQAVLCAWGLWGISAFGSTGRQPVQSSVTRSPAAPVTYNHDPSAGSNCRKWKAPFLHYKICLNKQTFDESESFASSHIPLLYQAVLPGCRTWASLIKEERSAASFLFLFASLTTLEMSCILSYSCTSLPIVHVTGYGFCPFEEIWVMLWKSENGVESAQDTHGCDIQEKDESFALSSWMKPQEGDVTGHWVSCWEISMVRDSALAQFASSSCIFIDWKCSSQRTPLALTVLSLLKGFLNT